MGNCSTFSLLDLNTFLVQFEHCICLYYLEKWIGLKRWAPSHKHPLVYFRAVHLLALIYQTNIWKHDGCAQWLFRKTEAWGFLVILRHLTSKVYFILQLFSAYSLISCFLCCSVGVFFFVKFDK